MSRLIKADHSPGHHDVVPRQNPYTTFLRFSTLSLAAGEEWTLDTADSEIVAVILTGTVTVQAGGTTFVDLGGRTSVFAELPTSVYLPRDTRVGFRAVSDVELGLCSAKAERRFEPFVISPDEVSVAERGADNWRRTVRDILTSNGEGRVDSIVVGETINAPGNWSSYPPHKHDGQFAPEEPNFEEIYFYKLDPPSGMAVQLHYTPDRSIDDAHVVRDGDTFVIEKGYHPLTVAGGHSAYYLWAMAGDSGRVLNPYIDPDYRWL
jgi:5-deoxy-glucuronate isomerase